MGTDFLNKKPLARFRIRTGCKTLHLDHPLPEMKGTNVLRKLPAVAYFSPHLVVFDHDQMGGGRYKGQEIVDLIKGTVAFERGEIVDISDGDFLDPKWIAQQKKDAEAAKQKAQEDRIDELETALDKALGTGSKDELEEVKKKLKEARAGRFECPYCDFRPRAYSEMGKKISDAKRKAGLSTHLINCTHAIKSDEEIETIREGMDAGSFLNTPGVEGDPERSEVSTLELVKKAEKEKQGA